MIFVGSEAGTKVRQMLNGTWKGDRVAIVDEDSEACKTDDKYENIKNAKIVEASDTVAKYYTYDRDYVMTGDGAIYEVGQDLSVKRFDTLIKLLSLDLPTELSVGSYYWLRGLWAIVGHIEATDTESKGKDITYDWDIEDFYRHYTDEEIKATIKEQEIEIPETGLWVGDIIGMFEDDFDEDEE